MLPAVIARQRVEKGAPGNTLKRLNNGLSKMQKHGTKLLMLVMNWIVTKKHELMQNEHACQHAARAKRTYVRAVRRNNISTS